MEGYKMVRNWVSTICRPVETHWHAAARSWLGMFLIQDYQGWKGQRRQLTYQGCWTMAPRSCSIASKSCSKTQNSRMCYVILHTNCIRMKMGRIGNMMRCRVQIGGGICRCVDLSSCPPTKPISQDSVVTRLHGWCIWALEISKKRNAISQQLGQWYLWGTYRFANLNAFPRKSGRLKVTVCFMSTCTCCWNHQHSPYQRRWFQPWWEFPFGQSSLFCRCTSQITPSNSGCLLQRKCLSNMPGTKVSILSTPSGPTSHTATSFLAWRWTSVWRSSLKTGKRPRLDRTETGKDQDRTRPRPEKTAKRPVLIDRSLWLRSV